MFNWWTFFFQVLNFFIVLYILYRLFFNPLRRIIQAREDMIAKRLENLEEREKRVAQDEERHKNNMKEIRHLRDKELDEARKQALIEKDLLMKETNKEIANAFEKQSMIIEQEREKFEKEIYQKSLEFSLYYSEKILKEISDEQLHQKRIDKFLHALSKSDTKEISSLREKFAGKMCEITLYTPFELKEEILGMIKDVLAKVFKCDTVELQILEDTSLIAGIRLIADSKVFDASFKGEL
ncbi:MAG: F0F1 ATP synthase subunit delta, partial [Campylobacterales bacterium]|nr:F0F1 ATP synthase subunit delta [Campylobacterales bacterium]